MAVFCPKPCGRLATAAVFIAIGVVQLLVGVILLRSKFADLLSGADFLTSATNLFVGCLYGIASSVWQNNAKTPTSKRTARKNTLAALLVTVIAVNMTAVIILLMSEGNELLSLPYFDDRSGHSSVDFAKEVFAFAYVASVCSPIVCLVVALVALSGNCCKINSTQKSTNHDNRKDTATNSFNWVHDEKASRHTTQASFKTSTSDSATSDFSSHKRKSMLHDKMADSRVLEWQERRAKILEHSELINKYSSANPLFRNEDSVDLPHERLVSRIRDSSIAKHTTNNAVINDIRRNSYETTDSSSKENMKPNTIAHHSSVVKDYKKVRSDSYAKAVLNENGIDYEEAFNRGENVGKKSIDSKESIMESKYCNKRKSPKRFAAVQYSLDETLPKTSYASENRSPLAKSNSHSNEIEDPEITRLKLQTLQELKRRVSKAPPGTNFKSYSCKERNFTDPHTKEKITFKSSIEEQSPRNVVLRNVQPDDISSPGEVFEPRADSLGITKSFLNMKNASPTSVSKNFSAVYPKPLDLRTIKKITAEVNDNFRSSPTRHIGYNSPIEIGTICKLQTSKDEETNPPLDVTCSKPQNAKQETPRRVASLASIAEVPSEEANDADSETRVPDLDKCPTNVDENSNIRVYSSPTRKYSGSPALIKSRSFSPKSILKKMWSHGPEVRLSVADMIVDEDSLIGLSDEELLARTLRIRDLRKGVEQRRKRENSIKMDNVLTQVEY